MNGGQTVSRISWLVVALICAAAFGFMMYSSLQEAAIVDEGAHIPAGYGYVRHLDMRLNPEHPPLLKAMSGLPLLFMQPDFPTDSTAWTEDINGQWIMGQQFMYESGNDADLLLQLTRLAPILLTILLILLIYVWSRRLMGPLWALLPAFLFAFSPTVLAHGHYVTTDIAAAFGILFGTYFFLKYLREPSPRNIIFAGLALGVAQLLKFSVVLLIPYFVLLAIIHFYLNARQRNLRGKYFWRTAWTALWKLLLVFVVAMVLIYAVYAVLIVNYPIEKQVADSEAILTSFAGGRDEYPDGCGLMRCVANVVVWMADNPVTQPLAQYFLGVLMVIQRSAGGNTAYFLGEVSASGSHIYFPVVYLLKESLPALIIVFWGLLLALWRMARRAAGGKIWSGFTTWLRDHFAEFAILLFVLIYWAYSINSTLNIGFRHLMPVIPLMYMLAAGSWRKWVANMDLQSITAAARSFAGAWLKLSVLSALLIWVIIETLIAAPRFISYFNQFGGGTEGGYRYVTDSNYDWGQDMLRLQNFLDEHPEMDRVALDYFGSWGAANYYLDERKVDWWSSKGNPAEEGIGWLAVSINSLQGAIHPTSEDFYRAPEDSYDWLTALRPAAPPGMGQVPEPDHRIGTTIFIYDLR